MNRVCLYCQIDISHMRKNATFCCPAHKNEWHNAKRGGREIVAPTAVAPLPASNDPGVIALLTDIRDLNAQAVQLLAQLVQASNTGHAVIRERVIEREAVITAPLPSPDFADLDNTLEVKKAAPQKSDTGRVLSLQTLLYSTPKMIERVALDDLEFMLGYEHVFPQHMVNQELARRNGLASASVSVESMPSAQKIKGSDIEFEVNVEIDDIEI